MNRPHRNVAARLVVVATLGAAAALSSCSCGEANAAITMPKKLRVANLAPKQRDLLRATLEIPGLLAPTELTFDESHQHLSGAFVLAVQQAQKADVTLRVFGRLSGDSDEVLVGLAKRNVTLEPRSSVFFDLKEADWAVDGAAVFDQNGNGASNIDDLVAGFDPAPPKRVLAVLPDTLQFSSGIRPGQFTRQVIVVENVSGLTQTVSPVVVGGQGVSITRIDPTGTPEGGAPRSLEPFTMQPFQEVLLAVTFAPTNEFLVRGSVALATEQPDSHVTSVSELAVIASSDGDPQPAVAGYDPGTVDGAAVGFSGTIIPFPPASLFGGQPIAPGSVQLSDDPNDTVDVPALPFATAGDDVGGVAPGLVFNVAVPPRNRLSVVLDGLTADVQLGLFVLDGAGGLSAADGESVVSAHPGASPEAAQFRNTSSTDTRRAIIVLSRVDGREPGDGSVDAGLPFALLAQLNSGPEFDDVDPLSRTHGDFRGGNDLTLHGIDFDTAAVLIGSHVADPGATVTSDDGARIDTVTPPGSTDDLGAPLTVVAINQNGEAATLPSVFTYDAPAPEIDQVDPPTGSTLGGTALNISGAFFSAQNGGARVTVGGQLATGVVVVSSNLITATAPTGSAGFTTLVVENVTADGSTIASAGFPFVYVEPAGAAPAITSVAPATGSTDGGDLVTLSGTGFVSGALVRFGGSVASDVTVASDTSITCRTPPKVTAGAVDLVVTNPDGQTAILAGGFSYATPPPVLVVATPTAVSTLGGTRVFLDGSGFRPGVTAVFAQGATSLAAPAVTFVNDSRIIATAPGGLAEGSADITVRNTDGQQSGTLAVDVFAPAAAPPRVLALNPASVRVDALNVTVTVTGSGFQTGMLAFLDTDPLPITNLTGTSFTFVPPLRAPGAAILRVANPDGQTDASALVYEDALAPVFTSVSPDVVGALVPGDVVTVAGQNLVAIDGGHVHLNDGAGAEYAATLVSASATALNVRVDDALPERGDFFITADFSTGTALSPTFAAIAPTLLSQQALSPPVDGANFTVLLQGSSLNHARITTARFVRDDDELTVEIAPSIATDSLVRVDSGGRLPQGVWRVALVYAFTDTGGQAQELTVSVPDGAGGAAPFTVAGQCGNGVLDAGEDCDVGGVFASGLSCTSFGFFGGTLTCDSNCHARTTQCSNCGDGIIDTADFEECDGTNFGGATCADFVAGSVGTLACNSQCQVNANSCSICGNGIIEGDEECDGNNFAGATCGDLGFNAGQISCDPLTCRLSSDLCSTCGNNRCDPLEDSSSCPADCVATCGNGTCDSGEACTTCPKDCGGQCEAPFSLSLGAGGGQSARFSADLAQAFVVHAQDTAGAPLVGLQIVLTAPPGGVVSPAVVLTDANGNASSLGTVSRALGAQTFTVTGTGPDGALLAGAPLSIAATATDLPTGFAGTLANAPAQQGRTQLLDGQGNAAPSAASKASLSLEGASGVVVRPSDGSIFVADSANNRVVRIAPDGELFLAAGSDAGQAAFVDNVAGPQARFSRPHGLALDANENLYIADTNNNRVRELDAQTGLVTTFAGGGTSTNENVLATTAQLSGPTSLVFAQTGDAFVLDNGSPDAIKKINTGGFISTAITVALCTTGNLRAGGLADTELTLDPQDRLVFLGQILNGGGCALPSSADVLFRLEADGTLTALAGGSTIVTTGAARGARLDTPSGLAMDPAGNAYVAERGTSERVRKVSATGVISTLAGTAGTVATSTTTGDGGPASGALFAVPSFLAFSPAGDLIITDAGLDDVRVVRAVAETTPPVVVATPFGGGQSATINQALASPLGVTVKDTDGTPISGVFVQVTTPAGAAAEPSSGFTDGNGVFSFVAFLPRTPGAATFTLTSTGLDGLPLGTPIVLTETATDIATGIIASIVNQTGVPGSTLSSSAARSLANLTTSFDGIAVDPDDGTVFYSDASNNRVLRVDPNGAVLAVAGTGAAGNGGNGPALSVALNGPHGLALDADKNLYIADTNNDVVRVLTSDGNLTVFAGSALNNPQPADGVVATGANLDAPSSVAVGPTAADGSDVPGITGNVFIVDEAHQRIRRVQVTTPALPGVIDSVVVGQACSSVTGVAATSFPQASLAFDKEGRLYYSGSIGNAGGCPVPDPNADYVFRLESDGVTQTALAGGNTEAASGAALGIRVHRVGGIAVDAAGNLYFAEGTGHRIRKVDVLGVMTTVAGDGVAGFTADNVNSTATRVNAPTGLAFDADDNLYVVDGGNERVRMIRGIGQQTPATATIAIVDGDAQIATMGQLAALPLRVRVIDGGSTPVVGLPVFFTALDLGDSVTQGVLATTLAGEASSTVRLGRSVTTPHRFQALARTWLDPVDIIDGTGQPPLFTLTAQRPPSGSTVAIANSQGTAGAVPPLSGFGEIAATQARLSLSVSGVALAADGTLFVSDSSNHRVVSISPEGHLSVFAGTGTSGFLDNVLATQAQLESPRGIALDAAGNVYIADAGGSVDRDRVRRVNISDGIITTIAGGAADTPGHGDGGAGSGVSLNDIRELSIGPDGFLYVVDNGFNDIRRIDPVSPFNTTSAVLGSQNCTAASGLVVSSISNTGLAWDAQDRMYFSANISNGGACPVPNNALNTSALLRLETDGTLTYIAGANNGSTGDGVNGNGMTVNNIGGLAYDAVADTLFFTEVSNHRLRALPGVAAVVAGQGAAGLGTSGTVRTLVGTLNTAGFSSLTAPGTGLLNAPEGVALDGNGDIYWTGDGSNAVRLLIP